MANIAVKPHTLKDVTLTIGTDDYAAHVSSVMFTPTVQRSTWQGLSPDASYTDQGAATWVAELEYAQDWETTASLSQYLMDNEGATKTCTFRPRVGVGDTFTASLILSPGPIGGAVNSVSTGKVTLGVVGAPTRADA